MGAKESVVDKAAQLIREEEKHPWSASKQALVDSGQLNPSREMISEVLRGLQVRSVASRKTNSRSRNFELPFAEDEVQKSAREYRRAKWGE